MRLTSSRQFGAARPGALIADLAAPFERSPFPGVHFNWIDSARGLAALIVLFWHYQHFYFPEASVNPIADMRDVQPLYALFGVFYEYGFYAVQLFWVISGFVLAHVYVGTRRSGRDFFVARFARLYPLHFVTLLIIAGLQAVSVATTGVSQIYPHNDIQHFLLHLAFAPYWGMEAGDSFNGPVWSVSVEIVSYALFWFLLPVLFRLGAVAPILIAGLAGAVAVALELRPMGVNKDLALCACYFFLGAGVYVAFARMHVRTTLILALVAIGTAAAAALWLTEIKILQRAAALALFPCMVLGLAKLDLVAPIAGRSLRSLGDLSYGMYMLHVPLQIALLLVISHFGLDRVALASQPWFLVAFFAAVIGLAWLCHRWFEKPVGAWLRTRLAASSPAPQNPVAVPSPVAASVWAIEQRGATGARQSAGPQPAFMAQR